MYYVLFCDRRRGKMGIEMRLSSNMMFPLCEEVNPLFPAFSSTNDLLTDITGFDENVTNVRLLIFQAFAS
jgi:hypothetical protein